MTTLRSLTPMFSVTDLPRTIRFYTSLGFKVTSTFGNPPVWACFQRDGVELMFNTPHPPGTKPPPAPIPTGTNYQILYIRPADVAALHAEYTAAGLPVTPLRVAVYGMKEFELRDPDDYWLWFGQETDEPPTARE